MQKTLPSIYVKTEFSMLESTIKIKNLINFALSKNIKTLFICDQNLFGAMEFFNLAKKNGIKPIIGLEIEVKNYKFLIFAKNSQGYLKLIDLSTKNKSNQDLFFEDIINDNLIIIDSFEKSYYQDNGKKLNCKHYFIGTNKFENDENYIYINPINVLNNEDQAGIKILNFVKNNQFDEQIKVQSYEFLFDDNFQAIKNIEKIISWCDDDYLKLLPKIVLPQFSKNPKKEIKKIIDQNFETFFIKNSHINKEIYLNRINKELKIIDDLNFNDYFLIIHNIVCWAKENKIVLGPGRGSSVGSIVSFLLNITKIDPIKYNLIFERFLNPIRKTMPDIDIDVQDDQRHKLIAYIFEKYGKENVALISTFQKYGAKMAIRDVCRYYKLPMYKINEISKSIPTFKINIDLKFAYKHDNVFKALIDNNDFYQKIYYEALLIEGLPRQIGIHAAGIVISNEKVSKKVPCLINSDGLNQSQYSMNYLEQNNLLKIDLLGLINLKTISQIQEEIFQKYHKKINLYKIKDYDQKINNLLNKGLSNGIFQLESTGMKSTLKQVKINSLKDIAAVISLFRPGPKSFIPIYAKRKNNHWTSKAFSPQIASITDETYGILIYQEQIMEIAHKIASFSLEEADIFRWAISKKKTKLLDSLKNQFINGLIKNHVDEKKANDLFNKIHKFGNYGFNKSHAYAYAKIAMQMSFLKAYFPFEFYTCLIRNSISSPKSIKKYLDEIKDFNIMIQKPNITFSNLKTYSLNQKIILPLVLIKGFGKNTNEKLINERNKQKFSSFFNFVARALYVGIGEATILLLIKANALKNEFGNRTTLIKNLSKAINYKNAIYNKKDHKLDFSLLEEPFLNVYQDEKYDWKSEEKKLFGFNF